MNKKTIIKALAAGLAAVVMMPGMQSCKSDYLEEAPITSISKADVQTLDGALYAMQGLCSSMYRQMGDMNWNNTCGEPYYCMMYGEALGNNYHDRIWNVYASSITKWTQMRNRSSMTANYMWYFCYGLINAANQILDGIDDIPVTNTDEEAQRTFVKAVTLTMRAHAYTRLLQVYGPRWADSNNGAVVSGVVLRLQSGIDGVPFSSTGEVMNQIYADLDEAISCFGKTTYGDQLIWTPNVNVAHGLKARAAAIKLDWNTVASEAAKARQGYPLMTAQQYVKGGFIKANDEYMWATWFQGEGMYYYSHGGSYACNGWTVWSWGTSTGIDFDLYRKIPLTDCRKGLYMAPTGFMELNKELADECGVSDASFFDPTIVASVVTINQNENKAMKNFVNAYACDDSKWPDWNDPDMELGGGYKGGPFPYYNGAYLVAGLQYKFWGVQAYTTNQFPFMRASEMGYLQAEAAYMLGDEATARNLLVELNKDVRDPDFQCTETGAALLDMIRSYRHIELWGEGFTWHDLKRWNVPLHRSGWVANDPTSGNYPQSLACDYDPSYNEGWRVSVPVSEFNYNKSIKEEELPGANR